MTTATAERLLTTNEVELSVDIRILHDEVADLCLIGLVRFLAHAAMSERGEVDAIEVRVALSDERRVARDERHVRGLMLREECALELADDACRGLATFARAIGAERLCLLAARHGLERAVDEH